MPYLSRVMKYGLITLIEKLNLELPENTTCLQRKYYRLFFIKSEVYNEENTKNILNHITICYRF